MKIYSLGIVATIAGALTGSGCNNVARDEAILAREILNYHSQGAIIQQCETAPSEFYHFVDGVRTSTEDETRGCMQLAIDKIAALRAGDNIRDLANQDKHARIFPRGDVQEKMQADFDSALLALRHQKPLPAYSRWEYIPELHQYSDDRGKVFNMAVPIYYGKSVQQSIDEGMFLSDAINF